MKKIILLAVAIFPAVCAFAQPYPPVWSAVPQVELLGKHEGNYFLAAVRAGRPRTAKLMLSESKAPLLLANVRDEQGNTPLMIAAEKGYFEIVRMLMPYGVNVNEVNNRNETALCLAAKNNRIKTVKFLTTNRHTKVDYPCGLPGSEKTALLIAAENGAAPEIIQALVDAKANVNFQSASGETALMAVAVSGVVKSADILLQAGADINATISGRRMSATFVAIFNDQLDMVKFLIENGGEAYTVSWGVDVNAGAIITTPMDAARSEPVRAYLKSKGYK